MWCQAPGEGRKRLKRRLRNRVHRVLKSTRTVKRDLAWPGQSPWPLYGKSGPGRPVGLSTQQGTSELVWANRQSGGGFVRGCCAASGLPGPATEPALCQGVQGLWQAGPPGTPLTRRDCRKVQGLLSSDCFEPPLLPWPAPHLEPSTPTGACLLVRHPPCK